MVYIYCKLNYEIKCFFLIILVWNVSFNSKFEKVVGLELMWSWHMAKVSIFWVLIINSIDKLDCIRKKGKMIWWCKSCNTYAMRTAKKQEEGYKTIYHTSQTMEKNL